MVYVDGVGGHMVANWPRIEQYEPPEVEYCDFDDGWAVCAPPDVNMDDFINTIEEPSDEEISQMEAGW
jgi:hypothetical protein